MSEDLAILEVGKAESELRFQSTLNQQIKLIEHLQDQNEFLLAKKKRNFAEKFFARDHNHHHKENKELSTPCHFTEVRIVSNIKNQNHHDVLTMYNNQ